MLACVKLSFLCLCCVTTAQALLQYADGAFDKYRFYADTYCIDFDLSSASVVRNLNHCLELAEASPASNGVMFAASNSSCVVLTSLNNDIVVRVQNKAGWLTAVKDISNTYKTVLKSDSAQGATNVAYSMLHVINNNGGSFTTVWNASVQSYDKSSSCKCTYRNDFLSSWNSKVVLVSFVRFRFWSNKIPVVSMVFNGTDTTASSWWETSRVFSSYPYAAQRIATSTFCLFGVSNERGFISVTGCGDCSTDKAFLGSAYSFFCGYLYPCISFPCFFYSQTNNDLLLSAAEVALSFAEFLSIEVKVESRVVFV